MPIYKGTTNLSLAKGTIPISSVYKGTTLVYSSYTWEQWYQTFLYNALIPQTINSKNVLNQAKVVKVESNGVVENQLAQFNDISRTIRDIQVDIVNNYFSLVGTASASAYDGLNPQGLQTIAGHKYLVKNISPNVKIYLVGCGEITGNGILTCTTADYRISLVSVNGQVYNEHGYLQIIDLTLMFGTGNEPTALTDTRIQALLNRGYISYNTGTYKGTDIGVISTKDSNNADLDTLTFKYQGNGAINTHDTFEITNSAYVFTKNIGVVDLGTLSWLYQSSNDVFYTRSKQPTDIATWANIICNKYASDIQKYPSNITDKSISTRAYFFDGNLYFKDTLLSGDTTLISGTLYYELATPQVISIPKKHLGIVDLGSLNWNGGTNGQWYSGDTFDIPHTTGQIANIYCSKYVSFGSYVLNNGTWLANDMKIMVSVSSNRIAIMDKSGYADDTAFKTAMSGVYLFYETESEVADIDTKIGIESGGTITSNWFKWTKNQMVSNGNFVDFSNWNTSGGSTVYSVANNTLTFKAVQRYGGVRNTINIIGGNKYLVWYELKMGNTPDVVGHSVKLSMTNMATSELNPELNTSWQTLAIINTANSGQTQSILYIRDYAESGWVDNQCKNVNVVDLTLAFGSGNEPTDINDSRIQYIINNGYIPTDTTGTETLVDSQVLPNIEFGVKAK